MNVGQKCLITVDGTDFWIQEPTEFDPKWYNHKINGPAVSYEVAMCVKTGEIVWINGPFAAGRWDDRGIARLCLNEMLDDGEKYIADGGYFDGYQWAETPDGTHSLEQRMYALSRARHETVNGRFKNWRCLKQQYRHSLEKHGPLFRSVAAIVQIGIMHGESLFSVPYNEDVFFLDLDGVSDSDSEDDY